MGTLETILVVDDDETILNSVVAILKKANFNVLSAGGGASAIKVARESDATIDLLLSDVNMSGMSGRILGKVSRMRDRRCM